MKEHLWNLKNQKRFLLRFIHIFSGQKKLKISCDCPFKGLSICCICPYLLFSVDLKGSGLRRLWVRCLCPYFQWPFLYTVRWLHLDSFKTKGHIRPCGHTLFLLCRSRTLIESFRTFFIFSESRLYIQFESVYTVGYNVETLLAAVLSKSKFF